MGCLRGIWKKAQASRSLSSPFLQLGGYITNFTTHQEPDIALRYKYSAPIEIYGNSAYLSGSEETTASAALIQQGLAQWEAPSQLESLGTTAVQINNNLGEPALPQMGSRLELSKTG